MSVVEQRFSWVGGFRHMLMYHLIKYQEDDLGD